MQHGLAPLLRQIEAQPQLDYVLATVIATAGSSYRKAGAMMLLPPDAEPLGLVSGGCLESDLAERADAVRASGLAATVHYDLSGENDALWGLGLGCGGRIDVLLERACRANAFAGLGQVASHWLAHAPCWLLKNVAPGVVPAATVIGAGQDLPAPFASGVGRVVQRVGDELAIPVDPPPRITVCGAGVDAVPLVAQCCALHWRVRVVDHRAAFARKSRFARAAEVVAGDATHIADPAWRPDAVVIMAHNLERDAAYLARALQTDAAYVGLLGPEHRRDEVCALAGLAGDPRLYGPAGLDIGATLPETIALSIVAQIQSVLAGRAGGHLAACVSTP